MKKNLNNFHHLPHLSIHQNMKVGYEFLQSKLLLPHRREKGKIPHKFWKFSKQLFLEKEFQHN